MCILLLSLFSCSDPGKPTDGTPPDENGSGAQESEPDVLDWCVYKTERPVDTHSTVTAKITVRDYGEITLLLDATTAPETVANFTRLASEGFYDGLTFHRICTGALIQGGDPNGDGTGGSGKTVKGEFSSNGHENDISHLRGVISMARSSKYDSASSQFFICNADLTSLDGSYAAFGYVIEGMSTVDRINEQASKFCTDEVISYRALQPTIESIRIIYGN